MTSKKLLIFLFLSLFLIGFISAECVDSDGGIDYFVKGKLTGIDFGNSILIPSLDDFCVNKTNRAVVSQCIGSECEVVDFTCNETASSGYTENHFDCLNGCINGACLKLCSSIGVIQNLQYCDVDGFFKDLKSDGETCANDYECRNQSCIDSICQSKYVSIRLEIDKKAMNGLLVNESKPNNNIINDLFDFILGIECIPENQNYFCKGEEAFLCGIEGVLESKGKIPGVCGYEETFIPPVTDDSGSSQDSSSSSTTTTTTETTTDFSGQEEGTPNSGEVLISELDGNICGDGICGTVESSYSCGEDCPATERGVIVYYVSLTILIMAVGGVGILVYFRFFKIHA